MVAYNQTAVSAHMTMAALANIRKYTSDEDYELILIEDIPKFNIRDDYGVLHIDNHIILDEYTNYTTKMNMAAKVAKGDYLCFIQNDVFVWEGWLDSFHYYFDNKMSECMMPDQLPRTRQYMLDAYAMTLDEGIGNGHPEDCLYFMTRDAFARIGGWNEDIRVLVHKDFMLRCSNAGVTIDSTNKIQVTHITLATHYQDMDLMNKGLTHDSLIQNHGVDPRSLDD